MVWEKELVDNLLSELNSVKPNFRERDKWCWGDGREIDGFSVRKAYSIMKNVVYLEENGFYKQL